MPPMPKCLKMARSHCCSPGLYHSLRGELPNVPAAGRANAAVLNASVPGPE